MASSFCFIYIGQTGTILYRRLSHDDSGSDQNQLITSTKECFDLPVFCFLACNASVELLLLPINIICLLLP